MDSQAEIVAATTTAGQFARKAWEREHWGLPRDESQRILWTMFFTSQYPDEELIRRAWTRPAQWVEILVRYGAPPAPPAVTHTGDR